MISNNVEVLRLPDDFFASVMEIKKPEKSLLIVVVVACSFQVTVQGN